MLNLKHAFNPRIEESGTRTFNQFKIVVIGLPNAGTTSLINRLLNRQFTQQTKGFKVYHCSINRATFEWKETDRSYQPPANDKSCIRAVIFEVIATKTILDLLYLLIAPEDIILLVYDPTLLSTASYMADIDYILNFVSAHCNAQYCSSAAQSSHFPVVLMMGICTIYKSYSQAINFFREHCHGRTYEKHILQQDTHAFHFIGGYKGTFPEQKIRFLKGAVLTAAEPLYSQHCPSVYLQFEQTILELYGHRSSLKVSAIADQIGIQATEQLLEHFRNKGIILYYPKVQGLQDKVFISPKLISPIIAIFELSDNLSLQDSFMQFPSGLQKWLVYLLKNFELAVAGHWSLSEVPKAGFSYDGTPYIMPLLIHANVVSKKLKPEDYVGVLYCFPDKFLPRCVFFQLITKLIDWFHADENTINNIKISKEYFLFESKDLCQLIVQLNSSESIKCYIKIPPTERAIKESLHPSLLDFIQKAVIEICHLCLPSAQKPVCYLDCPCDHGDNKELPHLPFHEISNKSIVICKILNIPIPNKYYKHLFRSNSTDDDSKEKDAYALALKEGKARPYSVRILIVGPENSGKTCLVESLLGRDPKSYSATQGADITVCKFYTTNWLRVEDELILEKIHKDFCSKLKATVMEQSKVPIHSDQSASSSSISESSVEHNIPSITVTSAVGEIPIEQSSLNRQLSLPINEEMPIVSMEDLREAELSSPVCENELNAVIWDVSGQTIYHGLLPAFLSEDNVAIITFDASRDLFNLTKAREDLFTENSINRKMTACQVVCYWCKAIYSICRKKGTRGTLSRCLPTIFLVATHIDKIGDHHEIEITKNKIIGLLVQEFTGKPFAQLLAGNCGGDGIEDALRKYCFFVSNLKRNQNEFCKLRQAINESCQHIFNQRHPVVFIKIEKQLLSLNKSCITTANFHEIARDCGFLHKFDSKQFMSALQYFHSKGIIMHFPFIESLNNLIVLSPQWLAKLLAYVIVAHPFKQIGSLLDKQYDCLIKEGVLYKEFFDHMVGEFNKWSTDHNRGIKMEPEQAMDFVKSFYIVAEIDKNTIFLNNVKNYVKSAIKDKLYLVPSMLPEQIQEIDDDEVFQNLLKKKFSYADDLIRIVHYQFPDGFVPTMTFSQVIAACIQRNTSRKEELSWLSRYHCKMVLGEDQYYYVSLCEEQDSICLIMTPDENGIITDIGLKERRELHKFFDATLINVVKSLSKKSEEIQLPIAHVPCPQCDKLHFRLEVVCATRKRALRCKTKIPLSYCSDLAEKANDDYLLTSQNLPDKKTKLSPRPGTPTMPLLMEHLYDVIQWKEFGMHLLPDNCAATEIEIISKDHPNDLRECKRKLYTVYLEQGAHNWERVVKALEKSKHPRIAKNIKKTFL